MWAIAVNFLPGLGKFPMNGPCWFLLSHFCSGEFAHTRTQLSWVLGELQVDKNPSGWLKTPPRHTTQTQTKEAVLGHGLTIYSRQRAQRSRYVWNHCVLTKNSINLDTIGQLSHGRQSQRLKTRTSWADWIGWTECLRPVSWCRDRLFWSWQPKWQTRHTILEQVTNLFYQASSSSFISGIDENEFCSHEVPTERDSVREGTELICARATGRELSELYLFFLWKHLEVSSHWSYELGLHLDWLPMWFRIPISPGADNKKALRKELMFSCRCDSMKIHIFNHVICCWANLKRGRVVRLHRSPSTLAQSLGKEREGMK